MKALRRMAVSVALLVGLLGWAGDQERAATAPSIYTCPTAPVINSIVSEGEVVVVGDIGDH